MVWFVSAILDLTHAIELLNNKSFNKLGYMFKQNAYNVETNKSHASTCMEM